MEEYRCLESTFSDAEVANRLIISDPVRPSRCTPSPVTDSDDTGRTVCWLLATYGYIRHAIYRLTAEQCNGAARDSINSGQLRPTVTLVEVRRGTTGWFDVASAAERQTTAPDDHSVYTDSDWSFLNGSSVINVYNDAYIATDADDEQSYPPDAALYSNSNHKLQYSSETTIIIHLSAATLASISVLRVVY